MAFDIEAYSYDDRFPDPQEEKNVAYQIGITFKNYVDRGFHRLLLHCKTPDEYQKYERHSVGQERFGYCDEIDDIQTCLRSGKPVGDCKNRECLDDTEQWCHAIFITKTIVENYSTEKELLLRFANLIVEEDPDLIYGYNSDKFDWNYIVERTKIANCERAFSRISRIKDFECKIENTTFNSSAYGDNNYHILDIPGRLNIDLMVWIQRNMPVDRYPSYSLNSISEKELDDKKRDVDAKEIFQAFRTGCSKELAKIGDYCCQDTVIVQNLVVKLDVVTQMFEMANITDTPPMWLLQKGQQIKCYSQISKQAMELGFLIPVVDGRDDGKFKGAIVLPPKIGKYDTPVAVLDFASLYPSIQVACQVCYSTIVLDDSLHRKLKTMKDRGETTLVNNHHFTYSYSFAQKQPCVIPELQVRLKKSRKAVRAIMAPLEHSKEPEDMLRYRVLNGRQLAIKVSMNSLYGFTSAFMMNLKPLSAAVTAKGRMMIEQTKAFMENDFETIAKTRYWTLEDVSTFFTPDGKQIVAKQLDDQWVFSLKDKEIFRGPIGVTPDGWSKKYPMVIQKKKTYIGLKYEMDEIRWKIDYKGIALKRRNYCDFAKTVLWKLFRKVDWNLSEGPDKAVEELEKHLSKLVNDDVDMDDFVISASLKANYKVVNLPHVQLAKRMKDRDEGSAPQAGQRYGYVVVQEDSRSSKLYEKSEETKYAKDHNIPLDYLFYLNQQIRKPVIKFLSLIGRENEAQIVFENIQEQLFRQLQRKRFVRANEVKMGFFNVNGKRPMPVEPLKPPKKTTLTKKEKECKAIKGMQPISSFFQKKLESITSI
ncbi:DNA polymerase family B-domain-containing protein [Blyttiomyces helicus]|uniref:DNA polymerase delta catalytic subunit n=1 Tax=Blyttiomyces helicus TaxID=388810 RepID=A0A4V1ISB8_9FUNG|nr:DNA polymerase family B-domain-containing protein [Blyttiomyces helicus]|eukprot:RKO93007.1 DNA polymerase family B-domain-containing protein [Blyttiomyces helicus]